MLTLRVKRLHISIPEDYILLGLVSPARDYKMAWAINQSLGITLKKADPISYGLSNGQIFWLHHYLFYTENGYIRLLPNKCERGVNHAFIRLLPEFKSVDYFLQIDDQGYSFDTSHIISSLKSLDLIQYLIKIENLNQKTKDVLAF